MSMYDCAVCGAPRCEHVISEINKESREKYKRIEQLSWLRSIDTAMRLVVSKEQLTLIDRVAELLKIIEMYEDGEDFDTPEIGDKYKRYREPWEEVSQERRPIGVTPAILVKPLLKKRGLK